MWLITTLIAALAVTAVYLALPNPKTYKLDWLAVMLWGASVMILVDHIWGYDFASPFIEFTTDGLIADGFILGISMLIPVFAIWELAVLVSKVKMQHVRS
ncbi:MAG: hypothetical protein Q6373_021085 [Candidatus Sigynarchaeota archaeon]